MDTYGTKILSKQRYEACRKFQGYALVITHLYEIFIVPQAYNCWIFVVTVVFSFAKGMELPSFMNTQRINIFTLKYSLYIGSARNSMQMTHLLDLTNFLNYLHTQ